MSSRAGFFQLNQWNLASIKVHSFPGRDRMQNLDLMKSSSCAGWPLVRCCHTSLNIRLLEEFLIVTHPSSSVFLAKKCAFTKILLVFAFDSQALYKQYLKEEIAFSTKCRLKSKKRGSQSICNTSRSFALRTRTKIRKKEEGRTTTQVEDAREKKRYNYH